jgi:hypothetical protein
LKRASPSPLRCYFGVPCLPFFFSLSEHVRLVNKTHVGMHTALGQPASCAPASKLLALPTGNKTVHWWDFKLLHVCVGNLKNHTTTVGEARRHGCDTGSSVLSGPAAPSLYSFLLEAGIISRCVRGITLPFPPLPFPRRPALVSGPGDDRPPAWGKFGGTRGPQRRETRAPWHRATIGRVTRDRRRAPRGWGKFPAALPARRAHGVGRGPVGNRSCRREDQPGAVASGDEVCLCKVALGLLGCRGVASTAGGGEAGMPDVVMLSPRPSWVDVPRTLGEMRTQSYHEGTPLNSKRTPHRPQRRRHMSAAHRPRPTECVRDPSPADAV